MPPLHDPPTHDPDVWLFDLDNTLYPARCNLFAQIDVRIGRYIADWLKVDAEEARREKRQYLADRGTPMGGMVTPHGVPPPRSLAYMPGHHYSAVPGHPAVALGAAPN